MINNWDPASSGMSVLSGPSEISCKDIHKIPFLLVICMTKSITR